MTNECVRDDNVEVAMRPTDQLFDEVYDRLKAMASRRRMDGAPGAFGTTELVHEVYLRMSSGDEKRFSTPAEFFAYAARAMRTLVIDAARQAQSFKAGGDQRRLSMTDPLVSSVAVSAHEALQLDAALQALEDDHARAARVVELHYFAGIDHEQIAVVLGVHIRTIERDWKYARAFLASHVAG